MKILFAIFIVLGPSLLCAKLVTTEHLLQSGSSIEFYPQQGESLSISKDLNHIVSDANYDIVMKNGNRIYFQNRAQKDDMYIIFNEPTDLGDVVVVKVNSGYFTYTSQSLHALPEPVQKVLRVSGKSKTAKKRTKHTKNAVVATEEFCFDIHGELCDCDSPKALRNQKAAFTPSQKIHSASTIEKEESSFPQQQEKESKTNIFKSFAQKFQEVFVKIKFDLALLGKKESVTQHKKSESIPKVEKVVVKKPVSMLPLTLQKEKLKPDSSRLYKYNRLSDYEIKATTHSVKPHFSTLPLGDVKEEFSYMPLNQQSKVSVPVLKKPHRLGTGQKTEDVALVQKPQDLYQPKRPKALEKISAYDVSKPYKLPAHTTSTPSSVKYKEPDIAPSTIEIPKVYVPSLISSGKIDEVPQSQPQQKTLSIPKKETAQIEQSTKPSFSQSPTLQKATVSHFTKSSAGLQTEPSIQEKMPKLVDHIDASQYQVQKPIQTETPPVYEKREDTENVANDKITITKIIDKKKALSIQTDIERMSDRVLGGGYSQASTLGKLNVQAYSNKKRVSAWVEVFKGKRRVKTFYSGSKKEITLPSGTYILKATYRTGTAKQKKNLGKVKLKEGGFIHKKVYFNVGKLKVLASRKGKPVYVKVEIYKKGSKRRYAYTFSSRTTGKAHLQLSEGKYKIIVIEHSNKKVFDNVYVKGNSSKTLTVEF